MVGLLTKTDEDLDKNLNLNWKTQVGEELSLAFTTSNALYSQLCTPPCCLRDD